MASWGAICVGHPQRGRGGGVAAGSEGIRGSSEISLRSSPPPGPSLDENWKRREYPRPGSAVDRRERATRTPAHTRSPAGSAHQTAIAQSPAHRQARQAQAHMNMRSAACEHDDMSRLRVAKDTGRCDMRLPPLTCVEFRHLQSTLQIWRANYNQMRRHICHRSVHKDTSRQDRAFWQETPYSTGRLSSSTLSKITPIEVI